jgi:tetratricopeptide (TPR) repeat protein
MALGDGVADDPLWEGDDAEAAESDPLSGLDAASSALALLATRRGEPLDARLESQITSFFEEQTQQLREQRALRLRHLHSASREGKLRRFGLRLRNGMQMFAALVFSGIGLGALVMIYDAFTSHSVVVEAFKAPSALESRGLTGDVVAKGVLDSLEKMQEATRVTDKGMNSRGAWASDIKIEVPETGVSIGELDRLLHERFGHDLHIGGELVQTDAGGLALTVRGEGVPAATFSGGPGDLGKLTVQAAEYVYGRSQPRRYAGYLTAENRNADSVAFLKDAFPRASSDEERAELANDWGNADAGLEQFSAAVAEYRLAMAFAKPRTMPWWKPWGNLVGVLSTMDEEAGWREGHAMLQAVASAPKHAQPQLRLLMNPTQVTWDWPAQIAALLDDARYNGGAGTAGNGTNAPAIADAYAWIHDPGTAARHIAVGDPSDPSTAAEGLLLHGYAALDRGDAQGAVAPLEAFYKAWSANAALRYLFSYQACFSGLAYGLAGRVEEAEAVFEAVRKQAGSQSLCAAFHGDVLTHAGDVAGAKRVWIEGLKAGPDLPPIPLHRGLFELGAGDLKAAEADLSAAAAKAPHWADPWKAWGDVLAREGRWPDALAKYNEALKHAPAWTELRQARDAAARRVGE